MKIKDIELANISRFRGELMGAAMTSSSSLELEG